MELSQTQAYFMYAHDYKMGYVGRTSNIKTRYYSRNSNGPVNNFADEKYSSKEYI